MLELMQDVTDLAIAGLAAAPNPRERLIRHFQRVRARTPGLVASLTPEDQMIQSMPETRPSKWHLAHTTWFFETYVLARYVPGYTPLDERYGFLFGVHQRHSAGRQPRSHARPQPGLLSRPTQEEVRRYRDHVNAACLRVIRQIAEPDLPELTRLILVGLSHERRHQERILADIKHVFWSNPLLPEYHAPLPRMDGNAAVQKWFDHPGGLVEIGCSQTQSRFCMDGEAPRHKTYVHPFRLAGRPVTCGEYRDFMEEGGYDRPQYWLSDGWALVESQGWRSPLYWQKRHGDWHVFTLTGLRPMIDAEPVCHVSYYEADAFARWAGKRLPTEAEWELFGSEQFVEGNLVECDLLHPTISPCRGDGPWQMFGDTWEWTASAYLPYPGMQRARALSCEHDARHMGNQMVLRGGSCITPVDLVSATYRHFLPPAARWHVTGIRLAADL
jgi:ergothioneine biosynthesis protein EgtB